MAGGDGDAVIVLSSSLLYDESDLLRLSSIAAAWASSKDGVRFFSVSMMLAASSSSLVWALATGPNIPVRFVVWWVGAGFE